MFTDTGFIILAIGSTENIRKTTIYRFVKGFKGITSVVHLHVKNIIKKLDNEMISLSLRLHFIKWK